MFNENGENAGKKHFLLFQKNVHPMHKDKLNFFLVILNLSSANAFSLYKPKILSSGKGLTLYHTIPTFTDPEKRAF